MFSLWFDILLGIICLLIVSFVIIIIITSERNYNNYIKEQDLKNQEYQKKQERIQLLMKLCDNLGERIKLVQKNGNNI